MNKDSDTSSWVEISQLITAVASFVVALSAIWYTTKTRKDDLEYRELSIRPYMRFVLDRYNGKITYKNVGLGPAYIEYVKYVLNDKVIFIDSFKENTQVSEDIKKELEHNQDKVVKNLINENFYYGLDKSLPSIEVFVSFPSAGDTIPSNEEEEMLNIKNIRDIEAAMKKLSLANKFKEWTRSLGSTSQGRFYIKYCSVTHRWCREAGSK